MAGTTGRRKLIVFAGPPCAGKSTLAAELSSELGVDHVEMDRVRFRLMPTLGHERATIDFAYQAMHFAVQLALERGETIIVDSTYGRLAQRRELETVAKTTQAPLFLVQCKISPRAAMDRFKLRAPSHPATDLTETRVGLLAERYPYSPVGLLLETATSTDKSLAAIRDYVHRGEPILLGAWSMLARRPKGWPGPTDCG